MSHTNPNTIALRIANHKKDISLKRNQIPRTVKTEKIKKKRNKDDIETMDYKLYTKNVNLLIDTNKSLISNILTFSSLIFEFLKNIAIIRVY